jgi:hypothetical protein
VIGAIEERVVLFIISRGLTINVFHDVSFLDVKLFPEKQKTHDAEEHVNGGDHKD